MGRQSARIYFQGKDHKEIYFNGHYHDRMYLTDSEGKAALVWEKIKGFPLEEIYLIEMIGDRYYAIGRGKYWEDGHVKRGVCWAVGDTPYNLYSTYRDVNLDDNHNGYVIIKENDGIVVLKGNLKDVYLSNHDATFSMLMWFIPIINGRLDFAGEKRQGPKSLYEFGSIVIGNGRTAYGIYTDISDNSKTGFQIARALDESNKYGYSQESIITTYNDEMIEPGYNKVYARCGRIFRLFHNKRGRKMSGFCFMFLNKEETAAEIMELEFTAAQKMHIENMIKYKTYEFYESLESYTDVEIIEIEPYFSGIVGGELITDYDKGEIFQICQFNAKGKVTMKMTSDSQLTSQTFNTLPQSNVNRYWIRSVFDLEEMKVSRIEIYDGYPEYNDDSNLMGYDNYRAWFRNKAVKDKYYYCFVWTDGKTWHEISDKGIDLYYDSSYPFSCFFVCKEYMYLGNNQGYFIEVDMSNDTYQKVQRKIFLEEE